ncbi:MAG: FUSC family protein [Desulfobacter sp.]|nr:MAG: FUSC family protein [Desulfobacter sp.]
MAARGVKGLADEFRLSSPVFRHALRAALAITVAIAAARGLGLAHSVWVPVTVLVVMRPSLGGTLHISWKRFAGTAMGAVAGVLMVCLKLPAPVVAALVLVMVFFIFYFKAHHYVLFTATLTVALVLILGTVFSHTWQGGAERMADTLLGIAIGLGASFLVWPNFARKNLRREMGDLIAAQHRHFSQLVAAYFGDDTDMSGLLAGRLTAVQHLDACTEKFTDAAIEPGLRASQRQELVNLADAFTGVHRTLTAMASTVGKSSGVFHGSILAECQGVVACLDRLFSALESYAREDQAFEDQAFNERFSRFMVFLGRMRSQGEFDRFPLDSRNNASAFIRQINRLAADLERARKGIEALRTGR